MRKRSGLEKGSPTPFILPRISEDWKDNQQELDKSVSTGPYMTRRSSATFSSRTSTPMAQSGYGSGTGTVFPGSEG